jgi:SRSO17 transposase
VEADALYGNNHEFLNALEDAGENFMADIHSNHKVWLECLALSYPSKAKAKPGWQADRFKLKSDVDESRHQSEKTPQTGDETPKNQFN